MSTGKAAPPVAFFIQNRGDWSLSGRPLKRKFDSLQPVAGQREFSYPSPPMSSPPSPPRSGPELSTSTASESTPFIPVSTGLQAPGAASLPPPPQFFQAATVPPHLTPVPAPLSSTVTSNRPSGTQFPTFGVFQTGQSAPGAVPGLVSLSTGASPSSTRTGRKSKSHVASACVNCKRAHLSCDVQRPCTRCVASGKQDTCFDVQHKKRGRPRLRDEGEFKVEQMMPVQSVQSATPAAAGPSSSRPIAATRHRRTDSLRSLRSQTSEGSSSQGMQTPGYPPPTLQAPIAFQQPPPRGAGLFPADVPTAYLDLDFVFIRANRPFQHIMYGGQEVKGRQLREIVAPADPESFLSIRNRLRVEREAREPAYMPPIMQSGQDPLQGVLENDVDRLSQGFSDHTYTWTRAQSSPGVEHFPARVRLAKAVSYFVVVTLPSFRPVAQALPPMSAPTFAVPPPSSTPEGYAAHRQITTQSAPPSLYYPVQRVGRPSPQQQPVSHTYPPTQPAMQYQQRHSYALYQQRPPPTTPRLPVAEPPTETTPFTPRSATREVMQRPGAAFQLPPLGGPSGAPPGPSTTRATETSAQHASGEQGEEEEEEEGEEEEEEDVGEGERFRSPKKRRRMGIGDVLHR